METINVINIFNQSKNVVLVFLFTIYFGWCAAHAKGPAEKMGKKIDQVNQNTSQYFDDSAITAKVKAEILKDPLTKMYEIHVNTTNRTVDLVGVVDNQKVIDRALEIARSSESVLSVKNNLFIRNIK